MKANEIRKAEMAYSDCSRGLCKPNDSDRIAFIGAMLREIAAQLAEQTEIARTATDDSHKLMQANALLAEALAKRQAEMNERSQPAPAAVEDFMANHRWEQLRVRPGCVKCGIELDPAKPTIAYCPKHQPAPAAEPPGSWPVYDAHVLGPSAEPPTEHDVVSECLDIYHGISTSGPTQNCWGPYLSEVRAKMLRVLHHYDKRLRDELGVDTLAEARVRVATTCLLGLGQQGETQK